MARLGAVAAALLALSGCAVDCSNRDWRQRGFDDGYFGHPAQDLSLAQACGRLGVSFSRSEYLQGWRDGHDDWDRRIGSMGLD